MALALLNTLHFASTPNTDFDVHLCFSISRQSMPTTTRLNRHRFGVDITRYLGADEEVITAIPLAQLLYSQPVPSSTLNSLTKHKSRPLVSAISEDGSAFFEALVRSFPFMLMLLLTRKHSQACFPLRPLSRLRMRGPKAKRSHGCHHLAATPNGK